MRIFTKFHKYLINESHVRKQLLLFVVLCPFIGFSQWAQIGVDIDGVASNFSGATASLNNDGTIVVIGSPGVNSNQIGVVRVYENISGSWTQIGLDINGASIGDKFGNSVSLSQDGSVLAIGIPSIPGLNNLGKVKVFENVGGTWTQLGADLVGTVSNGEFGYSVSLSDDGIRLAIGEVGGGVTNSGVIEVYELSSGNWVQLGSDILGSDPGTKFFFGRSVCISGDGTKVAGNADDNGGNSYFKAVAFVSGNWVPFGADIPVSVSLSPNAISLSNDGVVLAIGESLAVGTGRVKVYVNFLGNWVQGGATLTGASTNDQFGWAVSLNNDGSIISIGARRPSGTGYARIYQSVSSVWTQVGTNIIGETSGDQFGSATALSIDGSIIVVGAPLNPDGGSSAGHVRVFQDSSLGVDDYNFFNEAILFPNPSKNSFTIETNQIINTVSIYNVQGKSVKLFKSNGSTYDIEDLTSGIYFVKIKTNKGLVTKKLIKQ